MNKSGLGAPPRKYNISINWISQNWNKLNWFTFLMAIGSMSRSLTKMGSNYDLIQMRSYFAQLKPNTNNTLQKRSRHSLRSIDGFFCICENWVEAQRSLSPSSGPVSSRPLWRWLRFSKMLSIFSFLLCQYQRGFSRDFWSLKPDLREIQ